MKLPVHVIFRGMEASDAVEAAARRKVAQLERFSADIVACRVVIDLQQRRYHQGRPVSVRIELTIPGRQLVVNRVADEDMDIALRDAFDDMTRQLEDAVRQQRESRQPQPREWPAREVQLDADEGLDVVRTRDGQASDLGRDTLGSAHLGARGVGKDHAG